MPETEDRGDSELVAVAHEWLLIALDDLQIARSEQLAAWARCYHAQQCAEKAIKAVLTLLGTNAPKIHDLVRLASTMPDDWALNDTATTDLVDLSRWAVEPRYPPALEHPTKAAANKAADDAEGLLDAVVTLFRSHGFDLTLPSRPA